LILFKNLKEGADMRLKKIKEIKDDGRYVYYYYEVEQGGRDARTTSESNDGRMGDDIIRTSRKAGSSKA